jgi:DNA-binding transcriptional regulator YhcF (GntR family)
LTERIRAEYSEAPGLRLTMGQASRFLGIDAMTCERAFQELEDVGFLCRRTDGSYQQTRRV